MKQFTDCTETYTGTGRVLRIKEGFNPNSSSCGSIVFSIHSAMVVAPVLLAGAAAWISSRMLTQNPGATPKENTKQEDVKS